MMNAKRNIYIHVSLVRFLFDAFGYIHVGEKKNDSA